MYPALVRSFLRGWTRHGRLRDTTKLPRYFNPVEADPAEEDSAPHVFRMLAKREREKERERERERRFTPRFRLDMRICDNRLVSLKEQGALGVLEA